MADPAPTPLTDASALRIAVATGNHKAVERIVAARVDAACAAERERITARVEAACAKIDALVVELDTTAAGLGEQRAFRADAYEAAVIRVRAALAQPADTEGAS